MQMSSLSYAEIFFLLVCGHAVGDFALQTEWIALNKEPRFRVNGETLAWPFALTAHALHHGLIVFLITQSLWLGVLETVIHWVTDLGKGRGYFGFAVDQGIHFASKVVWLFVLYLQRHG